MKRSLKKKVERMIRDKIHLQGTEFELLNEGFRICVRSVKGKDFLIQLKEFEKEGVEKC